MAAIQWPLSSAPGEKPQEGAGRLINAYAEPLGEGARSTAVRKRTPGLASFATSSQTGFRGMQLVGSILYGAYSGKVYQTTSAGGTMTLTGNLTGTAKVFWARNNNTTPDLVVVDPSNGANVVSTGTVAAYPDADVGSPNAVCFLDGYFFFTYGNSVCRSSGINSTSINTLDYITAEAKSDTLLRPIPFNGRLLLFGASSTEVWSGNPVNETGFPFNRETVIQRGLAGRYAVAGHEDGFGKSLIWVGDDCAVYALNGYTPDKISPPDLDRLIEAVSDRDTLEASVYVSRGRGVFVISSPTWTWEFNLNSLKWNERKSHLLQRWRGTQAHYAFNKWLIGDTASGNILQIDDDTRTEAGNPLRFHVESAPIQKFPNRARIARVDLDISAGVGVATGTDPTVTDPTIEISVSLDGGATYGLPRLVKMGRQARARQRAYATRFGLSGPQGVRVKVEVSDAVHVGLMGGEAHAELRPG